MQKCIVLLHLIKKKEDWQSDRMRWTRNPVYPFPGIGGLNPSSSAMFPYQELSFFSFIKTTDMKKIIIPIMMLLPLMTAQAQTVLTEEQQLEQAQKQLEAAKKALRSG